MNTADQVQPSYADLESRLSEMEQVVAALRDHQVDAIVGDTDVALVHLRQVEDALRDSGERYRAFVGNSSEGIWRYELEPPMPLTLPEDEQVDYILQRGYLAECNEATARLLGYERAAELVGQRGLPGAQNGLRRESVLLFVRSDYRLSGFEGTEVDRHGTAHWLSVSFLGLPKNGLLTRIWGVQRDITERRRAELELRQRTVELTALLAITRDVASMLEVGPLLENILGQLRTVIDFTAASVGMRDGDSLVAAAYDGPAVRAQIIGRRVPLAGLASLSRLLVSREAIILDDSAISELIVPDAWSILAPQFPPTPTPSRSWLFAPLVAKNQMMGILVLEHTDPKHFTSRHAELAQAFADHAAVAIANARLYAEARQLAALNERQRLAAELHDSVSQAIYSISLAAHTGLANLDKRPERARVALDHIVTLADVAFTDIRSLIFELRPESLARQGLVNAIERQAETLQTREHAQVHLDLGLEPEVSLEVKETLYRIAQEAMNNIVKHARAKSVWLRLAVEGQEICLEVRDDGKGFDATRTYEGHLGLRVMRERAAQLGGTVTIISARHGGTEVRARLPLTPV